jgi:acetyltransferase-like isoleucine patch superfamily enzyme
LAINGRSHDIREGGTQAALANSGKSAFRKYRDVMGGTLSLPAFLYFELVTCLFGGMPGMLGLGLRKLTYPILFKSCGKGVIFGRNLTIRHPHRIQLGNRCILGDNVTLDAKGSDGEGIMLRDGVFVGTNTIITMAGGTITLDEQCNIGSSCRIGTYGNTRIGKKALLAAYVYIVGAHHDTSRLDIPILDQPNLTHGGATVGDGCWIGARVTVMDGCTIGHDAIVGAHAVVNRDIPAYAIATGLPAVVKKMRTDPKTLENTATKDDANT